MVTATVLYAPMQGTRNGMEFSTGDIVFYPPTAIVGVVSDIDMSWGDPIYYVYFAFTGDSRLNLNTPYRVYGDLLVKIGHIDGVEEVWE